MDNELRKEILTLAEKSKIAYVSSIDGNGYPNTKAMLTFPHDSMKTHYFSTNTSSKRVKQFMDQPKACIYFSDNTQFMGLMLVGTIEVCMDRKNKEMLWFDGAEIYYPKGVDDEDYCVYQFTAEWGNYYHGLSNCSFKIEELEDTAVI